ncbi:hypothetical protein X802_02830 [Thermococcus guaymasensis DSM 11113]|uniref:tRNA-guanine(15) transglycosylase-like domain-containing protein n=1 Tax=Thermococcus guaymasensis DSM 11113 TaxID=1432656 RepID=A0A0X1KN07_9EURY|nr:tRNA-guanine transglycosylase [Thermococcus guaymasensis]AJC72672.1 hypothetical protein X802_02830 [Thermococcus guaymasensis DSM 11113]
MSKKISLKFPFMWLTQLSKLNPKPWDYFRVEGVMLNAYDILTKPYIDKKIREKKVHNYLGFDGYVTIDSGGFLFMKHNKVPVSPEQLVELYEKWKPNFAVSLDHPIFPSLPENIIKKRQIWSLNNIKTMVELKKSDNPVFIPVIHGYSRKSLEWYIKELERIGEFDIYGLGSLVPLVKGIKGVNGRFYKAIDLIKLVKELVPDRKIHVFGIGGSLTMHLMFLLGVNSIDSSSWRFKAAYGAIQLPGKGDRYITGKAQPKYRDLSEEDLAELRKCECPACTSHGVEGLRSSFKLRAIHNAWVYQKEVEIARQKIEEGTYQEYVWNLVKDNPVYRKLFKYITDKTSTLERWL